MLNDKEEAMISAAENEVYGCGCDVDTRVCIDGAVLDDPNVNVDIKEGDDDIELALDTIKQEAAAIKVMATRIEAVTSMMHELYDALPDDDDKPVFQFPDADELAAIYTPSTLFKAFIRSLFV